MLDLLIREPNRDGTGAPRSPATSVCDGRIVASLPIRAASRRARVMRRRRGLVFASGVIDIHTHYDVQSLGSRSRHPRCTVSPSSGKPRFSIAPLARRADYVST
jgi:N-acyl-D-aspartate/D-glutamate deacylase